MPSAASPALARTLAAGLPGMAATIQGTGAFVPEGVITNADLERLVDTSDSWIRERTGIRERRRAGTGMTASAMASAAGRAALADAGLDHVDTILVATCTPDTFIPPVACFVQRDLGLAGTAAMDVNAACSGFVDALIMGRGLIAAGTARTVLVIGAEALTQLVDYGDRATCVLFGDGAGAAVLGAGEHGGILATSWGADGTDSGLIYYGAPDGEPDGDDRIRMAGKGTFRKAVERMAEIAAELCETAGWTPDDVDLVVPHQANARIIEAVARRAGLPLDRFAITVDRFGNTGAASIPLALAEAAAAGRLRDGARVLIVAFGAGATWGGVAMEWNTTRRR